MVTAVPLSLQRDWDLLAKMPREVMYTESAERKRRMLWGSLLVVLALVCSIGHISTFPRVNIAFLPYTLMLVCMVITIAMAVIAVQESTLSEQYHFLQLGVPYVATVIRRSEVPLDYDTTYQVVYCFVTPDRVATGALSVSQTQYDELELDTPLLVLVDPQDSYRFILYDSLSDVTLKP